MSNLTNLSQSIMDNKAILTSENIRQGVTIFGVEGSAQPAVELNLQTINLIPTTQAQTIIPDENYDGIEIATIEGVNSSIDIDIQPENIKAGVSILGIEGTLIEGLDTSDGTAKATDIVSGETAYVNNEKIIGTYIPGSDAKATISSIQFSNSTLDYMDLSIVNTAPVSHLSYMFSNCKNLTGVNFTGCDFSNVINAYSCFSNCTNLAALEISNWETSKCNCFYFMFYNCTNLEVLNISNWSIATNSNMKNMFTNCAKLSTDSLNSIAEFFTTIPTPKNTNLSYFGFTTAQRTSIVASPSWAALNANKWKNA